MKNKIICVAFAILLIACCAYSGFSGALREKYTAADYNFSDADLAGTSDLFENLMPTAADPAAINDEKTQPHEEAAEDCRSRNSWMLSFAGDCTIGTLHEWQHSGGTNNMLSVIGSDYAYPFKNVVSYFKNDDLTLVNLEGTFTESTNAKSKDYCFRASPVYTRVLTEGSIEAVSIANNHTGDYLTLVWLIQRRFLTATACSGQVPKSPLSMSWRTGQKSV